MIVTPLRVGSVIDGMVEILDANGDLFAYAAGGNREQDIAKASMVVQAVNTTTGLTVSTTGCTCDPMSQDDACPVHKFEQPAGAREEATLHDLLNPDSATAKVLRKGAEVERDAIVRWLRDDARMPEQDCVPELLALAIERGSHRQAQPAAECVRQVQTTTVPGAVYRCETHGGTYSDSEWDARPCKGDA